jgi:CBS domain containing-hemolysin-like protein
MVPRRQIPQAGERFEVGKGVVIEVLEVTPRRVKTVRVRRRAGADDAAESRAEAR